MVDCAVYGDRSSGPVGAYGASYEKGLNSQSPFPLDQSSKRPYSEPLNPPVLKKSNDHYRYPNNRHHPRQQNRQRWQGQYHQHQQQYYGRPEYNQGYPTPPNYQGHQGHYNPPRVTMGHPHQPWQNQPRSFGATRPDLQFQQFHQQPNWMGPSQNRTIPPNNVPNNGYRTTVPSRYVAAPQVAVPRQYFTTPECAKNLYATEKTPSPEPALPPQLNVNELYEQLKQSGVLNLFINEKPSETKEVKQVEEKKEIEKISFDNIQSIKTKHEGLFKKLYQGNPCSSCGLRFGSDETEKYRKHLDWHFRQNKRERESKKKSVSRGWYMKVSDWMDHEATEDIDESQKPSYFEIQMNAKRQAEVKEKEPCVPAGSELEPRCKTCLETFKMYFDDDEDDWYISPAVKFQNTNLHPDCVEDYKKMLARGEVDNLLNDSIEKTDS